MKHKFAPYLYCAWENFFFSVSFGMLAYICMYACMYVCNLFLWNKHQTQSLNYLLDKKVSVLKFHGPYAHPYIVKVNQSHYRPGMPGGFQEVKVPKLRYNGPGWW